MPAEPAESGWYTVRCIFRAPDEDATSPNGWYEERLTLWQARSHRAAIELAEAEAVRYASVTNCEYIGLAQSFHLFETPGDGKEVFSLIRGSGLSPTEYINRFFDTGRELQSPYGSGVIE